jgi:hypothetical protein
MRETHTSLKGVGGVQDTADEVGVFSVEPPQAGSVKTTERPVAVVVIWAAGDPNALELFERESGDVAVAASPSGDLGDY